MSNQLQPQPKHLVTNYKDKNCIVSGGSGFIGQNLVKQLLSQKAIVFVIDNFSFGSQKSALEKGAVIIEGDIRDDKTFKNLPKEVKYDYFFHFAAPSSITLFNKNPLECIDITINGFFQVSKFCLNNNIRLVYPSTGSLYSGTTPPQTETSEIKIDAINSYARTKLALEFIQKTLVSLDSIGLRIFAGYGPQEKHKGEFASVVYLFCKDMVEGKSPVIFGDGTQERDFIYIDDVVEAILILGQHAKEQNVNVGSGEKVSFNRVINIINSVLGSMIKPTYIEKPNLYLEKTLADIHLLKTYYIPKVSLESGIKSIIRSLR
jgi:nucleoside-diphosphate-sugar epimerase